MGGDLAQEYAVVSAMLDGPTLALLRDRDAPLVMTVLTVAFRESSTIGADRFHALVDQVRVEVEGADPCPADPAPDGEDTDLDAEASRPDVQEQPTIRRRSARELCNRWVEGRTRWLTRQSSPSGEVYLLTEAASDALGVARSHSRARTVTTRSTVQGLVERAHHTAMLATDDPTKRAKMLEDQIADLHERLAATQADLDRVRDGHGVVPVSDEEVFNAFLQIQAEGDKLVADLRLVEADVRAQGEILHRQFLADERPVGQILTDYIHALTTQLSQTRHGQGYDSARTLLEDWVLRQRLQTDIETVLAHPFTTRLDRTQIKSARGLVSAIHVATSAIMDTRTSIHTSLSGYVHSRHADTHRALPRALAEAEAALDAWRKVAGRRSALPVEVLPVASVESATLRVKVAQARAVRVPAVLAQVEDPEPLTRSDLVYFRQVGGPRYQQIAQAVGRALESAPVVGVEQVVECLPTDSRRPIDVLGLLSLAGRADAFDPAGRQVRVRCRRPDGSGQVLLVPAVVFTRVPELPIELEERS